MNGTPRDTASPKVLAPRQNGAAIRALREKDGWSQAGLAKAAGLDQSDISRFETESANASVATLNRIARALRVPAAAVMRELPELAQPEPVSESAA